MVRGSIRWSPCPCRMPHHEEPRLRPAFGHLKHLGLVLALAQPSGPGPCSVLSSPPWASLGLPSGISSMDHGISAFLSLSGTPTSYASPLIPERKQRFQLKGNVPFHLGCQGVQEEDHGPCPSTATPIFCL